MKFFRNTELAKVGFADAALNLPPIMRDRDYLAGYAIAEAVKETKHLFKDAK